MYLPAIETRRVLHTHIHLNKENVSRWIIIPEEPSWALHLLLTRTRETATFGISFQESFPEEKEQGGQWKAGGCCAMQHNMYVCVDNCYYCYY